MHTHKSGYEGGFKLQRSQRRADYGSVVIGNPFLPVNAYNNGGVDPKKGIIVPGGYDAVVSFHTHPFEQQFGAQSAWPSSGDLLNIVDTENYGLGHIHGILGQETKDSDKATLHLTRIPVENTPDISDLQPEYVKYFRESRYGSGDLGAFFGQRGIGYTALTVEVQNGQAMFDFSEAGGIGQALDQLFVN